MHQHSHTLILYRQVLHGPWAWASLICKYFYDKNTIQRNKYLEVTDQQHVLFLAFLTCTPASGTAAALSLHAASSPICWSDSAGLKDTRMELFWECESTHRSEGRAQPSDTCDTYRAQQEHTEQHRIHTSSTLLLWVNHSIPRIRALAAFLEAQDVTVGWVYMTNTFDI